MREFAASITHADTTIPARSKKKVKLVGAGGKKLVREQDKVLM
jgi:hypothetical protein